MAAVRGTLALPLIVSTLLLEERRKYYKYWKVFGIYRPFISWSLKVNRLNGKMC